MDASTDRADWRSAGVRGALRAIAVLAVVATAVVAVPGAASAASPSDSRATFFSGNVTTCSAVGFGSAVQMGSSSNSSSSDANVTGTVKTNAGTVQPGQGQELDVAITPAGVLAGVVIDAVVVKGSNGYNVYSNPAVLPPTLPPDQHYISPLNNGGNVPAISHWFVCYHLGAPPTGSLSVVKAVEAPDGVPVMPLPTSYTAIVNCNDGVHTNIQVTFGAAGGAGSPASITGIAPGTVCTVVEQNTASFPAGSLVSYNPSGADTTGVMVGAGAGVVVTITNDFSDVEVQRGSLLVRKVVVPPNGTPVTPIPSSFAAHVSCDDGTEVDVTLPGAGGDGTPTVTGIKVGSNCTVVETTIITPPATTSYDPPGVDTAGITITSTGTVTVAITNDFSGVPVQTGTLRVIKSIVSNNGGAAVPGDFNLHVKSGTTDVSGSPAAGVAGPGGRDYVLPVGAYTVSEDTPTNGYAFSGFSGDCNGQTGAVTVVANQTVTCTITNDDIAPQITVIKHVQNDNGGTATANQWTMNVTGTNVQPSASFPGAESPGTTVTLNQGSYSVDESGGVAGYAKLLSADCSGTILVGQTKACTITNDDIAPELTVIKHVINDNDGTATANQWTMNVTGTNVASPSFAGAESPGVTTTLNAGTYSVDESGGPSGYAKSLSADCSGSIAVGQTKTCTITNDDAVASLIVIKHVINDNGGTATANQWTMNVDDPGVDPASFPGAESPGVTVPVDAGAYSVDESSGPSGYAQTLSPDCSGTILVGQTKTCTITNDDIAGRVIVIKHMINDNGGTATANQFTMTIDDPGANPASFPGAESPGTTVAVDPGSYSVDEMGPSGYQKSFSADCSGTIALVQTKTCTVTNDDIKPELTVIKHVVGGPAAASDFTMRVDGAHVAPSTSFPGSEAGTTVTLDAGEFNVSEAGPTGYDASGEGCAGTLEVGEKATCVVTNVFRVVPAAPITPPPPAATKTLAFTGANPGALAAIGAALVGAGLLLLLLARRRRSVRA